MILSILFYIFFPIAPSAPLVQESPITVYLPLMANQPECEMSTEEGQMYYLIASSEEQERLSLSCNNALTTAARQRAAGLANGDPWGHCDRNSICANEYARSYGCNLPPEYGPGNYVESLVAGTGNVRSAYDALIASESHRPHLRGEGDFYGEQTDIGVGYYVGGEYGFYFSIMIAKCE